MKYIRLHCALIVSAVLLLATASCGGTPIQSRPTVTPRLPTTTMDILPVTLPAGGAGFFLVAGDQLFPLAVQHLSEVESVFGYGLPQTGEAYPMVIFRDDSIDPNLLMLRRMLGGVGFNSKLERDLGGVLVEAIRPGFGADTGGLEVGDLIVAVGEESLQEALFFIDFDERFLRMILGDLGSVVTVGLHVPEDGDCISPDQLSFSPRTSRIVDGLTRNKSLEDFDVLHLIQVAGHRIAVHYDHVGVVAGQQRTNALPLHDPGTVASVGKNRFLTGDSVAWEQITMPTTSELLGLGNLHLLPVIRWPPVRAATNVQTMGEEPLERY